KAPTIDQSLFISDSNQHINSPISATFRIKNNSSIYPVNIGRMKVEGRDSNGQQYDFPSTPDNTVIAPGQTYNYNEQVRLKKTGTYTFRLMNYRNDYRWSDSFPESSNTSIQRSISVNVADAVTVVNPLILSAGTTHVGSEVTAAFSIRNFSS